MKILGDGGSLCHKKVLKGIKLIDSCIVAEQSV